MILYSPKLRFKEFADEWQIKKLGDIGEIIGGGTPDTTRPEYWNGEIIWLTPTEVKEKYISESMKTLTQLGLKNSSAKLLPVGTIIFTSRATIGDVGISQKELTTNQGFQSVVVNSNNSNIFFYYWIAKNMKLFLKKACGSTFLEINKTEMAKVIGLSPQKDEQEKIADFLTAVDEKISLLEAKKEQWEKYKKGVMQAIFSQKIRFKKDDGSNYSDWEEKKLGEIADFYKGVGISKDEVSENGTTECIRYGELYTTYKELIKNIESKTNLDSSKLFLSKSNDVIIPSSGETNIDIATASCVLLNNVALGGDLNVIRSKVNGIFLSYYLNNCKRLEIAKLAQGNSVVHLYSSQLKNLMLLLPCQEEQEEVARLLTLLDYKINLISKELEQVKLFKKSLLQQMFV